MKTKTKIKLLKHLKRAILSDRKPSWFSNNTGICGNFYYMCKHLNVNHKQREFNTIFGKQIEKWPLWTHQWRFTIPSPTPNETIKQYRDEFYNKQKSLNDFNKVDAPHYEYSLRSENGSQYDNDSLYCKFRIDLIDFIILSLKAKRNHGK